MPEALTIDKPETIIAPYEGIFTDVQRADDGRITWKATVSDDGVDKYATRMTTDLHEDFIRNWKAGEPCFLTIGHFFGASRIGETTAMYRDGRKLKAEGRFFTDDADPFVAKLAQAAANAALAEAGNLPTERTIKTSIGFNPRAYVNEDLDVMAYTKGELPEITMTTHAANSRTDFGGQDMTKRALNPEFQQEDAASIVGDELAAEIASRDAALREERAGEPEAELLYRARTVDSDELPANVKKMDDAQRKAWVKTYNAALKNESSEADAKKAANAFVKNMGRSSDSAATIENAKEERAGRKIQGKKLAQLKEAAQQIADILAWAEQADDDEGRSIIVRAHFTEPLDAGAKLDETAEARYMDLTGEESLAAILDYKAMWDYLYTLQYSFMDLLMANLNPESELSTPERMANIDNAFGDFKALVNGILSQYFSNDGRAIEEGDNTDMNTTDVKPTDKGTATVKPEGESAGRTKFDDVADRIRQHIIDGDRDGLQELLNTDLAPALLEDMGEEPEAEANVVTGRLEALEVQNAGLNAKLDRILDQMAEPPEPRTVAPEAPHPYRPSPPRRSGFTRPPAEPQTRTQRITAPAGPKRYSISEAASLKTSTPYP